MNQVAFVGAMEEAKLTQDLRKRSHGYSASHTFFFRTQKKRPSYFISVAVMNSTLFTQFLPLFFIFPLTARSCEHDPVSTSSCEHAVNQPSPADSGTPEFSLFPALIALLRFLSAHSGLSHCLQVGKEKSQHAEISSNQLLSTQRGSRVI